jgi:hypothetical protein
VCPAGSHFYLLAQIKVTKTKGLNTMTPNFSIEGFGCCVSEPTRSDMALAVAGKALVKRRAELAVLACLQQPNPLATAITQMCISGTLLWLLSFVPANESDRLPGAPAGSHELNDPQKEQPK